MPALLFLGLAVIIHSLFVTNFFYIKYLRRKTDIDEVLPIEESSSKSVPDDVTKKDIKNATECSSCPSILNFLKAMFVGIVNKEPMTEMRFMDWKSIPYRKGLISTAFLLTVCNIVFTPDVLNQMFRFSDLDEILSPNLCEADDYERELKRLNETLEVKETQLPRAREQHNYYEKLNNMLKKDTSLYGTEGYECGDIADNTPDDQGRTYPISGSKSVWLENPDQFPMSRFGSFFPGYCGGARELAIDNAKNEKCIQEYCECIDSTHICTNKVCIDIPVTCPAVTSDDEIELEDYRQSQLFKSSGEVDIEMKSYNTGEKFNSNASNTVEKMISRIDIAGSLYVVYIAIAIFFPVPLQIFRRSWGPMIRQFFFGANKTTFITLVLAIWWGCDYLQTFMVNLRLQLNINMLQNPCYVDNGFLNERGALISDKCDELQSMSNKISLFNSTINNIIREVNAFDKICGCTFPFHHSKEFDKPYEELNLIEAYKSSKGSLYVPDSTTTFFGNDTICTNPSYAKQVYMQPPEASANMWDIWIKTGLAAMIVLKISVTNFGVALLRYADPFSICDGKYEYPPEKYSVTGHKEDLLTLKSNYQIILKTIALRSVLFWGILTNLSLINIFVSRLAGSETMTKSAMIMTWFTGTCFVLIGIVIPFVFALKETFIKIKARKHIFRRDKIAPISESTVDT